MPHTRWWVPAAAATLIVGLVGACDRWTYDNPHDPDRCDPVCSPEQQCRGGVCVSADAGPADAGPPDLSDGGGLIWLEQLANSKANLQVTTAASAKSSADVYIAGVVGLPKPAENEAFVAAYDAAGKQRWSKIFTGHLTNLPSQLAVGPDGTLHVAGHFFGDVDFAGTKLQSNGQSDAFWLQMETTAGAVQRVARFGMHLWDSLTGVAVDSAGQVTMVGSYTNNYSFLGGDPFYSRGGSEAMLGSFSSSGGHRWSMSLGGPGGDAAQAVVVDAKRDVIVAGQFSQRAELCGPTYASVGQADVFVLKLDLTGKRRWVRTLGSVSNDGVTAAAMDTAGNLYLALSVAGALTLPGRTLPYAGSLDAVVLSLDPAGGLRWSFAVGDVHQDKVSALAVNAAGEVLIGGSFNGTVNLGGATITSEAKADAFVAKLDPASGRPLWLRRLGGSEDDAVTAIAAPSDGTVVAAGTFFGTLKYGGKQLTSEGGSDAFVVKLSR